MGLFPSLGSRWAVDFGTDRLRIAPPGASVPLIDQPHVGLVAELGKKTKLLAIGDEALQQANTVGPNSQLAWPMRHGVIKDFIVAEQIVRAALRQTGVRGFLGPMVIVTVNDNGGQVERRAIQECWDSAGARKVYLVEQCMAAAAGAGLKGKGGERGSFLIASLGAGVTEALINIDGAIVAHTAVPIGGRDLDAAIVTAFRRQQGQTINPRQAERLRLAPGSDSELINEATAPVLERICEVIWEFLEVELPQMPPTFRLKEIYLTGGLCPTPGLANLLQSRLPLRARIAKRPEHAAIVGCAQALLELTALGRWKMNL